MICFDMIRNGDVVASVVTLPNRKCVVSWPTSTIVYDSEEDARRVHIEHMGGRGEETSFRVAVAAPAYLRGIQDCYQDCCEGIGLRCAKKGWVEAPKYVPEQDAVAYCIGYESETMRIYGVDWRKLLVKEAKP